MASWTDVKSPSPLISTLIVRLVPIFCVNRGESITVCAVKPSTWPENDTARTKMVAKEATWAGFRDIIGGKDQTAMMFFKESRVNRILFNSKLRAMKKHLEVLKKTARKEIFMMFFRGES